MLDAHGADCLRVLHALAMHTHLPTHHASLACVLLQAIPSGQVLSKLSRALGVMLKKNPTKK